MPQTIYAELCYPQGYFVLIFLIESIMIVPICIYNTCIYSKYMPLAKFGAFVYWPYSSIKYLNYIYCCYKTRKLIWPLSHDSMDEVIQSIDDLWVKG